MSDNPEQQSVHFLSNSTLTKPSLPRFMVPFAPLCSPPQSFCAQDVCVNVSHACGRLTYCTRTKQGSSDSTNRTKSALSQDHVPLSDGISHMPSTESAHDVTSSRQLRPSGTKNEITCRTPTAFRRPLGMIGTVCHQLLTSESLRHGQRSRAAPRQQHAFSEGLIGA